MRLALGGVSGSRLGPEEAFVLASQARDDAVELRRLRVPRLWPALDRHAPERLRPGAGVVPIRLVAGMVRALGAQPAVVVEAPMPGEGADPAGWIRRLQEGPLGALRDPALPPAR